MHRIFLFTLILLTLFTSGCASTGSQSGEGMESSGSQLTASQERDRLEKLNKEIYRFNTGFDKALLKPVAKGYDKITPGPVSIGITNFFQNLSEPRVMVNNFLQGKIHGGMTSLARFVINSTVGIGGLVDWAGLSGAPYKSEDFGQTMAVWGWKNGDYVMLPILGPSNVRDTLGEVVDFFSYPLLYYKDEPVRNGLYVLRVIDLRANNLATTDILEEAAGDKEYEFVREAYKQQREHEIHDGAPKLEGLEFIEDD